MQVLLENKFIIYNHQKNLYPNHQYFHKSYYNVDYCYIFQQDNIF